MRPGAMITAGIGGRDRNYHRFGNYPILQSAADTLYLEYINHCKVGSESFTRIYPEGSTAGQADFSVTPLSVEDCTATIPIADQTASAV